MMDNIQAFPMATGDPLSGGDWVNGMTLRDYFAGQALIMGSVFCAINDEDIDRETPNKEKLKKLSGMAYEIADAMLKQREGY